MGSYRHLSDQELLVLLKSDEIAAFEEIYNRYWAELYSSAYKRTSSREASEEIVQDFFTSLWLNRTKIQIEGTLVNYLRTSIRYRVFNYYSKEYVRKNYLESVGSLMKDFDNSTEETILLNDLTQNLEREISRLPLKCRSVYTLSRIEHKSNKEIAAVLGISEKTVENHMSRALKYLRMKFVISLLLLIFIL
jgi:RNA polymerase sigma-70 factor (ECF subfamily)